MKMLFFTDNTNIDYLMITIKDYLKYMDKKPSFFDKYKIVFVDPGVIGIKKNVILPIERKILTHKFLDSLPKNHFLSMDFPSDMNEKFKKFLLDKSWNYSYNFCYHSQFIVTVQFYYNNFKSFKKNFDRYNNLDIRSKILGIGNMCRYKYLDKFVQKVIKYCFRNCRHERMHFYGLNIQAVTGVKKHNKKYYRIQKSLEQYEEKYGIKVSVDNTNWTRCVDNDMKKDFEGRVSCRKETRTEFLNRYKKEIKSRVEFNNNFKVIKQKSMF